MQYSNQNIIVNSKISTCFEEKWKDDECFDS
jgi:hypothetical protein